MSVSRVEYDAALERVQEAWEAPVLSITDLSERFTLAALGLKGPPPEACECGMPHGTVLGPNTEHADECPVATAAYLDGVMGQKRVPPPVEPPKACPTCERDEYRRVIRSALDVMEGLTDAELGEGGGARRAYAGLWHAYHAVPAGIPTGGSGIDGGTAT